MQVNLAFFLYSLLLHSFSCCSKASNISFCKLCFVQAVDFLVFSSHISLCPFSLYCLEDSSRLST